MMWSSLSALVVPLAMSATSTRTLTLEEALKTASEHTPVLRKERATVDVAMAKADEARAPLLPQATVSGTYQRTTANPALRPGFTTPNQIMNLPKPSWTTYNFWQLNGQVQQLLWDFQTLDRWRSSKASADAEQHNERATKLDVELNVRAGYFGARANKDLVKVQKENLANTERHLAQTEGFVQVGTRPELDLAQARTDRANALVQLIQAENNYDVSKAQLNQVMGVAQSIDYEIADEILPPVPEEGKDIEGALQIALAERPEMKRFDELIRAQELLLSAARGTYYPSLGVSTGVSDVGIHLDSLVWNWNFQALLTWNIFQGLLSPALVAEAKATLVSVQSDRDSEILAIRLALDQALLAIRAAKATLDAANEALLNAKDRLRLAEGRYQAGVGNAIELGDAQVALVTAGAQVVSARFQLAIARAQLLRALGKT
jgi:outer membrane protein